MLDQILNNLFNVLPNLSYLQFALTILVAFAGGLIRGYTGFAGALLLLPGFVFIMGPLPALNVVVISGMIGQLLILPNAVKNAQKAIVLYYGIGIFVGVYMGLYFLFQREIPDITFFMGIFIIIATLILLSGWKYKGKSSPVISTSIGGGIGFFAGFFGVPTGPLTGLFFLSKNDPTKIIYANIQCTVILTVCAFFSYFFFIEGYEHDYLLLGIFMAIPLAIGLKCGQLLFKVLPESIFRPITYICLIILGATLSFNAYS
jgi:uncharacterized membrane protein YfcA